MSDPEPMTLTEFLAWDPGDELRYELVDGVPVALPLRTAPHARLAALLGSVLHERLRPGAAAYAGGGIRREDDDYDCRIPDLIVSCTRSRGQWVEAPRVLVDCLSPANRFRDWSLKLAFYRSLPTVEEILLVRTDRRHVEHWRREGGLWTVRDLIGSAEIALKPLSEPLPLEEIYGALELEE